MLSFSSSRLLSGVVDSPITTRGWLPCSSNKTERPRRCATIAIRLPPKPAPNDDQVVGAVSTQTAAHRTGDAIENGLLQVHFAQPLRAVCAAVRTGGGQSPTGRQRRGPHLSAGRSPSPLPACARLGDRNHRWPSAPPWRRCPRGLESAWLRLRRTPWRKSSERIAQIAASAAGTNGGCTRMNTRTIDLIGSAESWLLAKIAPASCACSAWPSIPGVPSPVPWQLRRLPLSKSRKRRQGSPTKAG